MPRPGVAIHRRPSSAGHAPAGAESAEATALESSVWAAPAWFFVGWVAIGSVLGLWLGRHGHHRRTMLALGAGLGPLMAVVVADAGRRRAACRPLIVRSGQRGRGGIDVVVVVPGDPRDVRSVVPSVRAVADDVHLLTVVRVIDVEAVEADESDEHRRRHVRDVEQAARLLPGPTARLALVAGSIEPLLGGPARPLVLHALPDDAGRPRGARP